MILTLQVHIELIELAHFLKSTQAKNVTYMHIDLKANKRVTTTGITLAMIKQFQITRKNRLPRHGHVTRRDADQTFIQASVHQNNSGSTGGELGDRD